MLLKALSEPEIISGFVLSNFISPNITKSAISSNRNNNAVTSTGIIICTTVTVATVLYTARLCQIDSTSHLPWPIKIFTLLNLRVLASDIEHKFL
jgi:hypothetical protein